VEDEGEPGAQTPDDHLYSMTGIIPIILKPFPKVRDETHNQTERCERTVFIPRLLPISASFCDLLLQYFSILVGLDKQTGQLATFSSTFADLGTLHPT